MKFRIIRYYDRYLAQVLKDDKYVNICSPAGYCSIKDTKDACRIYKENAECSIVEEFEL